MSDEPKPKRIQTNDFHVERILPQNPDPSSQWVKDFKRRRKGALHAFFSQSHAFRG